MKPADAFAIFHGDFKEVMKLKQGALCNLKSAKSLKYLSKEIIFIKLFAIAILVLIAILSKNKVENQIILFIINIPAFYLMGYLASQIHGYINNYLYAKRTMRRAEEKLKFIAFREEKERGLTK